MTAKRQKLKLRQMVLNLLASNKGVWFSATDIVNNIGAQKCGKNPLNNVNSNVAALFHEGNVERMQGAWHAAGGCPKNFYRYCDVLVVPSETTAPTVIAPRKLETVYDIPLIAPPPYRPHPSERYHTDWDVARGGAMQHARCPSVGTP